MEKVFNVAMVIFNVEEELSVIFVGRRTKKGVTDFNQKTNKDLVKEKKVKDKVLKKTNEKYVPTNRVHDQVHYHAKN
jgi:hypothetical protein